MSSTINPIENLKDARSFAEGQTEAEFLLVRKQDGTPNVGKLPVGRTVQQELSVTMGDALTDWINRVRSGQTLPRKLNPATTIEDRSTLQCAPSKELPDSELFDLLSSRKNHGLTSYTEDPKPDFQFIRISEPAGKLLIGVQQYSSAEIVDTDKFLSLWYNNEEYEKFQGDLLVIRPNFNAIYFDGWLFVISPKSFEQMFEMREKYERRTQEAIQGFEDSGIHFIDKSRMTDWMVSHINILRGMYEIYDQGLHEERTPEDIEQMIKTYRLEERSSLEYITENGEIQIGVDEYTDTWKILKLLSGKYAEDDILGTQWEIDSGQRL